MKRLIPVIIFFGLTACGPDVEVDLSIGQAMEPISVTVTDNEYTPAEIEVTAGQSVTFTNIGGNAHDIVAVEPEANKNFGVNIDNFKKDQPYTYEFDRPGEYSFYCSIHGTKKGSGMAGTVIVK